MGECRRALSVSQWVAGHRPVTLTYRQPIHRHRRVERVNVWTAVGTLMLAGPHTTASQPAIRCSRRWVQMITTPNHCARRRWALARSLWCRGSPTHNHLTLRHTSWLSWLTALRAPVFGLDEVLMRVLCRTPLLRLAVDLLYTTSCATCCKTCWLLYNLLWTCRWLSICRGFIAHLVVTACSTTNCTTHRSNGVRHFNRSGLYTNLEVSC